MAVAKMKLISIIGHMDSLDHVVAICGKRGVFQPDDAMSFFSDTSDFSSIIEENPYSQPLSMLDAAIARIQSTLTVPVQAAAVTEEELLAYVQDFSRQIKEMTKQRSVLTTQIEGQNKDIEQFEHFRGLDIDLDTILSCETIKVRFGRLPKESFEKLRAYNDNPYVLFFPGAVDNEYYWGVYFSPMDFADDVDRIFSGLYFERLRIPAAVGTPEQIVAGIREERDQTGRQLEAVKEEIKAFWQKERMTCLQIREQLARLAYLFDVRKYAARYNDKFILAGWIPAREEKKFCVALDEIDAIEYSLEKADADTHHTPPVTLHNARPFRAFEYFVDMYGLPQYNEVDPTAFVAITYTLLFGVMFGDLGQGLLVALVGWIMWKYKQMGIGRILIPCGISSAVFGVVFGSVFGFENALNPLYHALFGLTEKPIDVMNSSMATGIILLSVGIGLALLVIAMMLNIYSSLRRHDYESGVFGPNGIAGLTFYVALIAGVVAQMMFDIPLLTLPYVLGLVILPVVLIFLREPLGKLMAHDPHWRPEKWGGYIVQNLFELFEVMLSYVSNTMSFLRVGAFVLVHAGMMMAVFAIAGMFGSVGYVIAVIVGNILVMGMEALLVAIQVMRLEFYEMFSRYYQGDGRAFEPLTLSAEK